MRQRKRYYFGEEMIYQSDASPKPNHASNRKNWKETERLRTDVDSSKTGKSPQPQPHPYTHALLNPTTPSLKPTTKPPPLTPHPHPPTPTPSTNPPPHSHPSSGASAASSSQAYHSASKTAQKPARPCPFSAVPAAPNT